MSEKMTWKYFILWVCFVDISKAIISLIVIKSTIFASFIWLKFSMSSRLIFFNLVIKTRLLVFFSGFLPHPKTLFRVSSHQYRQFWRYRELRSLLLYFFILDLTSLIAASISITLDEGSDTFIVARRKEIVRSVLALSQVLRPVS